MIIIISVLKMVDLYRKDRSNSAGIGKSTWGWGRLTVLYTSSLLFYFIIIIISVLEMVDLYRKDRGNSASRKVDLRLGETIKLYCIQARIR